MNKGSTLFLRATITALGLVVLGLCAIAVPDGVRSDATGMYRPILLGLYVPAIPFFIALLQSIRLLDYIDQNKAFSQLSVNALTNIKYCAVTIAGLFTAGLPYIYIVADADDAPGVMLLGLVIVGASIAIATFAAVLQKLLHNAIEIQSENELTV